MMAIDTTASTRPAAAAGDADEVGAGMCGQGAAQDGGAGQGEADGGDQPTTKRFASTDAFDAGFDPAQTARRLNTYACARWAPTVTARGPSIYVERW